MKSLHSRDKNLIFNYNRERYIEPQSKSNLYIPYVEGTKQNWRQIPVPSGQDQNTFFRVNKTPQPILSTRLVGAIDPLSGTVAKLPKTVRERQAAGIVSTIESILTGLRAFMTSPERDADGNIVIDPITNKPVVKVRTIAEILVIAHTSLIDAFNAGGVVPDNNQLLIMQSLTVNSSILVVEQLRDLEKVQPGRPQAERSELYADAIIKERLRTDDQIRPGDPVEAAIVAAIDEQNIPDDWQNNEIFTQQYFTPDTWEERTKSQRGDIRQFITKRESNQGLTLTTFLGAGLSPVAGRAANMTNEFRRTKYLDLESLRFVDEDDVPEDERDGFGEEKQAEETASEEEEDESPDEGDESPEEEEFAQQQQQQPQQPQQQQQQPQQRFEQTLL